MPRSISEYTLADWKRLRPVIHTLKNSRYRWIDHRYMRRPAQAGDPAAVTRAICGHNVLVTVGFNDPEVIDWQALLLRYYVPRAFHIIVDNSSDKTAAEEIANISSRYEIPYLKLPENPWHSSSRSHGIALNWTWRNILQPGNPRTFGYIDDDLFPTAPDNPFAPLDTQDFFGFVREAGPRWFLWAGYCTFRFDAVKNKPLDFGQDWFIGLDTGGCNWDVLYRHVKRDALQGPSVIEMAYKPGIDVHLSPLQWYGTWLHEGGTNGNAALAPDKRRVVANILTPHLKAARQIQHAD